MTRINLPPSFTTRLLEWRQHWQQRPRLERWIILVLAVLVALTIFWLWIWQPANRHLDQLNAQLPQARAQLDAAREQWREGAGLTRQEQEVYTTDARAAFTNIVERFSAASAMTALETRGQQVDCTISALPFVQLVSLLDALQKDARFYVIGATITPLKQGGMVRAEIVFARPD